MLTGDLFALRPGDARAAGEAPAPPVALPALEPAPAALPRGPRWRRIGASATISASAHVALTLAFLWVWYSMWHDLAVPDATPIEIVHEIPGEKPAAEPEKTAQAAPKPDAPKPEAPKPAPPKPEPPAAKADPLPPPPAPPPPRPSALEQALQTGVAEPPAEAKPAESQSAVNQAGNTVKEPGADKAAPAGTPEATAPPRENAKPAEAPAVLTARQADTSVPPPAPETDDKVPPSAGDPGQAARQTAKLAAALPMSGLPMPTTFRAALSALGSSDTANYRGSVFGALSRARGAVDDQARALHLKGQVVLAIALSDTGAIDRIAVLQSSGHADSDAFAMDLVRRAAPFPPPPPGASRSFNPVITFGDS